MLVARPPHVPRLRVALAYNLRTEETEAQAERLRQDYVDRVHSALRSLGHDVVPVEVSGEPAAVLRRLQRIGADLVFNLAEGEHGVWREAFYPMMYEFLGLPHTCAGPGVLGLGLDKRLTEEALRSHGVRVPRGALVTPEHPGLPEGVDYPLLIKPNFEGSSMGIHQESVVETPEEARRHVAAQLDAYPAGLDVEEFVEGRELTIGFLAGLPDGLTEVVEYRIEGRRNIMDYETKMAEGAPGSGHEVRTLCPAPLTDDERRRVRETAARAFGALRVPDAARADLRMRDDGRVYLIEVNPLPGLRDVSPLTVGARALGLSYRDVIECIVASAAGRYRLLPEPHEAPEPPEAVARALSVELVEAEPVGVAS